jgi:hypothetical protein
MQVFCKFYSLADELLLLDDLWKRIKLNKRKELLGKGKSTAYNSELRPLPIVMSFAHAKAPATCFSKSITIKPYKRG